MTDLLVRISDAVLGSDDLDDEIAGYLDGLGIPYDTTLLDGVPPWTQSMEYARTLVPQGYAWSVSCNISPEGIPDHTAMVAQRSTMDKYRIGELWKSNASTPALALTHCALKAKVSAHPGVR